MTGDLNTNVASKAHPSFRMLEDLCHSFGLEQLVKQSTRVGKTCESTIDLISVYDKAKISQSGTIECGISDHKIIFCSRKVVNNIFNSHKSILSRSFKNYTQERFIEMIDKVDWSPVLDCSCVNKAWKWFKDRSLKTINMVAPLRQTRVKQRSSTWYDGTIHDAIKVRVKAFRTFHRTKTQEDFTNRRGTRLRDLLEWQK